MTQGHVTKRTITGLSGKKIVVDLTPMLPGGENGGAKLMTLELIRALAKVLPGTSFVLLTAESSHSELEWLEIKHSNVSRMCVLRNVIQVTSPALVSLSNISWNKRAFQQLRLLARNILSQDLIQRIKATRLLISAWKSRTLEQAEVLVKRVLPESLKRVVRRWRGGRKATDGSAALLQEIGANLLFCPFTAPFYADPSIPTVSVIYDLQYRAYPQFFTPEERIERENNFRIAYQKANHLVAISEFVRKTVIEAAKLSPERVSAIPIGLLRAPEHSQDEPVRDNLLEKYKLRSGQYILYPANFWKHKNHAMLLTAFNIYRRANPDSRLKLLCTGAPGPGAEAVREAACRMGLEECLVYPGYVTPDEFDMLLRSAFAMVFPSLYEGFGIPVLEAMSAGVPVLCSNVTSLPEVGGDAVLYFNPGKPLEIVEALARLSEEPGFRESLIQRGLQRAPIFESADRMAFQYMDVFMKALLPPTNSELASRNGSVNGE